MVISFLSGNNAIFNAKVGVTKVISLVEDGCLPCLDGDDVACCCCCTNGTNCCNVSCANTA